jgi:cell division GTPase FtsZ
MNAEQDSKIAIIGCGPSGCCIAGLLKQSQATAFTLALDDNEEVINATDADKKVLISDGKFETGIDLSRFKMVFIVCDPAEGQSLTYAQVIATQAANKAYTFGILIKPEGGWQDSDASIYSSFDTAGLIDAGWVFKKRGGKDIEDALKISFNFIAHMVTFLTGSFNDGIISVDAFKNILNGKVASFAATAMSQPETLYLLTMSDIDKTKVSSAIILIPYETDSVTARRLFIGVSKTLSQNMDMATFKIKGMEPFKIFAILASRY